MNIKALTEKYGKLFTDDDFEHPQYPNQTRLKIIPIWNMLTTEEQQIYRKVARTQRDITLKALLPAIEEARKEERERIIA